MTLFQHLRRHTFTLAGLIALLFVSVPASAEDRYDTLPHGPRIGASIAQALDGAMDHKGKPQSLKTLRGKKGLILLFSRSFDW